MSFLLHITGTLINYNNDHNNQRWVKHEKILQKNITWFSPKVSRPRSQSRLSRPRQDRYSYSWQGEAHLLEAVHRPEHHRDRGHAEIMMMHKRTLLYRLCFSFLLTCRRHPRRRVCTCSWPPRWCEARRWSPSAARASSWPRVWPRGARSWRLIGRCGLASATSWWCTRPWTSAGGCSRPSSQRSRAHEPGTWCCYSACSRGPCVRTWAASTNT